MKQIELLAPAGNFKCFIAACNAGADAIYMGVGKHNARVMAQNFTEEEYISCIDYAHLRGIKVYLTLNTVLYDDEMKEALEIVSKLYSYGLDAVIVQDLGFAMLLHQLLPDLALHASTQMSVYSLEQVKYLEKLGFQRVVLARELTLEEIQYICEHTNLEIEAFVHGALCVSLSGQCLLSSTIGNRSANRGRCAQPCRMKYDLYQEGSNHPIIEKTYVMSKKDIYGLDLMEQIVKAKIHSLKIEGRNKSPEYVALIVSKYRKYLNRYLAKENYLVEKKDEKEILQMFNRNGKSYGYLNGIKYQDTITKLSPKNTGLYLGKVKGQRGKFIQVQLEKEIALHDGIEIYSEGEVISNIITCIKDQTGSIRNEEMKKGETAWLGDIHKKIKFGSPIYQTSSEKLNLKIQQRYVQKNERRRKVQVQLRIEENVPVHVHIQAYDIDYDTVYVPEKAIKKALDKETVINAFSKTLDTAFFFELELIMKEKIFLPVSVLNEIRREIITKLEEKLKVRKQNGITEEKIDHLLRLTEIKERNREACIPSLMVYQYDSKKDYIKEEEKKNGIFPKRLDFMVQDYMTKEDEIFEKYASRVKLSIVIPNFVLYHVDQYLKQNIEKLLKSGVDTVILSTFSYMDLLIDLKKKYSFTLIADYAFNISNSYTAVKMIELGFDRVVPSYDISISDICQMSHYVNLELVKDLTTVLTSRYCILGSFIANRDEKCKMPCRKNNYYLKDSYGYQYAIVCDSADCIMRLVKKTRNISKEEEEMIQCIGSRNIMLN